MLCNGSIIITDHLDFGPKPRALAETGIAPFPTSVSPVIAPITNGSAAIAHVPTTDVDMDNVIDRLLSSGKTSLIEDMGCS